MKPKIERTIMKSRQNTVKFGIALMMFVLIIIGVEGNYTLAQVSDPQVSKAAPPHSRALAPECANLIKVNKSSTISMPETVNVNPTQLVARNVVVDYQTNAPLEVISVADGREGTQPYIKIILKNVTGKTIRAYGLALTSYARPGQAAGVNYRLGMSLSDPEGLHCGSTTIEYLVDQQLTPSELHLSIDFVEFEDGVVCGPDTANFREYVLGFRKGIFAVADKLIAELTSEQAEAILQEITRCRATDQVPFADDDLALTAPETASPRWQVGFQDGMFRTKVLIKGMDNKLALRTYLDEIRALMRFFGVR
jgi:hypothetical protein